MTDLSVIGENLLNPAILFFLLGFEFKSLIP